MTGRIRHLPTVVTFYPKEALIIPVLSLDDVSVILEVAARWGHMFATLVNSAMSAAILERSIWLICFIRRPWGDLTRYSCSRSRYRRSIFDWWGRSTVLLYRLNPALFNSAYRPSLVLLTTLVYLPSSLVEDFYLLCCKSSREWTWWAMILQVASRLSTNQRAWCCSCRGKCLQRKTRTASVSCIGFRKGRSDCIKFWRNAAVSVSLVKSFKSPRQTLGLRL